MVLFAQGSSSIGMVIRPGAVQNSVTFLRKCLGGISVIFPQAIGMASKQQHIYPSKPSLHDEVSYEPCHRLLLSLYVVVSAVRTERLFGKAENVNEREL